MRLKEWIERKTMRKEMDELEKLYLKIHTAEEQKQMELDHRMLKEREIDDQWKKYMAEQRIDKEQKMTELQDAADMR